MTMPEYLDSSNMDFNLYLKDFRLEKNSLISSGRLFQCVTSLLEKKFASTSNLVLLGIISIQWAHSTSSRSHFYVFDKHEPVSVVYIGVPSNTFESFK